MAALAHGRPLISTRGAEVAAPLAHGENLWLVPPGEAGSLAEAIGHLAQKPGLREQLGKGAAAIASRFTWERIAAETAAFFEEVIDELRSV